MVSLLAPTSILAMGYPVQISPFQHCPESLPGSTYDTQREVKPSGSVATDRCFLIGNRKERDYEFS